MDTIKENPLSSESMDLTENKETEIIPEPKKSRKYDTSTARNQKKLYREIQNRENEAQTENLKFIYSRLANIDNKLTSVISSKRKFDETNFVNKEEDNKKQKIISDSQIVEKKSDWNIKGNLINLALGAVGTFTIKLVANYIRNRYQRKTNDGDDIEFSSHTF